MIGYADADGSMAEDWRATSGYAFLVDSGAVSWSMKQQEIVLLSTTESEYIAATHAAKEALWLHSLIGQVFGPFPLDTATTLFFQQPVCNSPLQGPPVSRPHQTYRHTFPLHPLDNQ